MSNSFRKLVLSYDHNKTWEIELNIENIKSSEELNKHLQYYLTKIGKQAYNPKTYNFVLLDVFYYNKDKSIVIETKFGYPLDSNIFDNDIYDEFKGYNSLFIKVVFIEESTDDEEEWPF